MLNTNPTDDNSNPAEEAPDGNSNPPVAFYQNRGVGAYKETDVALYIVEVDLGGRLMHAPAENAGYLWNGYFWEPDRLRRMEWLVRERMTTMAEDAQTASIHWAGRDPTGERAAKDYPGLILKSFLNAAKIRNLVTLIRADERITADPEDFDRMATRLATPTGEIDLTVGKLTPADPAHLLTRATPTGYVPHAEAPRFEQFVDEITEGDKDQAIYLQKILGSSLFGRTGAQEFYIFHGLGSNGKDTLLEIVEAVLGAYCYRGPENMLMQKQHEEHLAEIYALRGRRLIIHAESDKGKKLNIGRIKYFTGTPTVNARAMRGDPVEFTNTWTHILMTNYLPALGGSMDDGIARRIIVIPFPAKFHKADDPQRTEGDPVIIEGLGADIAEEEAEGILAWLVTGARLSQEDGLVKPEAVRAATEEYLDELKDPYGIAVFLKMRTEKAPYDHFLPWIDIEAAYHLWASEALKAGDIQAAASMQVLAVGIAKAGYPKTKARISVEDTTKVVAGRKGLRLVEVAQPVISVPELLAMPMRDVPR